MHREPYLTYKWLSKAYSGVSLGNILKRYFFQERIQEGIKALGKTIETMAEAEGLIAHKKTIQIRRVF